MAASSLISKAGTRSRRPTGSSASTAGIEKRSNPAVCSLGKIAAPFLAVYVAKVRITVQAGGSNRLFEKAMAPVKAAGRSPGEVHDIALKAAETDATKRALATFGKPFGLALYGAGKVAHRAEPVARQSLRPSLSAAFWLSSR